MALGRKAVLARYHKTAKRKAALKRYNSSDKGLATRRRYAQTKKGKAALYAGKKQWESRNPDKHSAHQSVGNAVHRRTLLRQPCEVCGNPNSHGHHDDYSRRLEVRWLCQNITVKHIERKHNMAVGKGRYDDLCTYVREQSKALGACVMVFGGAAGWGFSIQAPPLAMLDLAKLLRHMADVCEQDSPKDIAKWMEENPDAF